LWNAYSLELVVATLQQRSVRAQKIDKESTTEDDINEELIWHAWVSDTTDGTCATYGRDTAWRYCGGSRISVHRQSINQLQRLMSFLHDFVEKDCTSVIRSKRRCCAVLASVCELWARFKVARTIATRNDLK